ncbi:hypothetical protein [Micromonospora sp. RP3T]|uniref:hypothetical protein n=1 Tax=Micromonospora sp. RP3T TaxID=2135446 RepID=UPI0018EB8882|nr:hypothetical protein [Micromonospora sp. RP3T]
MLPLDVAERLEREPNATEYIVGIVRARMRAEDLDAELAKRGLTVSDHGRARARAQRAQVEQEWPPGRRKAVRERSRRAAQDAWRVFGDALDRPARDVPGLREPLSTPPVLEPQTDVLHE